MRWARVWQLSAPVAVEYSCTEAAVCRYSMGQWQRFDEHLFPSPTHNGAEGKELELQEHLPDSVLGSFDMSIWLGLLQNREQNVRPAYCTEIWCIIMLKSER